MATVDAVARHRFLSTDQIAALYFPAAGGIVSSQCRTRLRHLVDAGFLTRFERPVLRTEGSKPALFGLAAAGLTLLVSELGYGPDDIDWRPDDNRVSWAFLDHQIMLNDVFIALNEASEQAGWTLSEWVDDRILKKMHTGLVPVEDPDGRERRVTVVPDAYFALASDDRLLRFFVEADRATMTVISSNNQKRTWQKRIHAYQAYFDSPLPIDTYGTKRIRVLTVTTSPKRLESLKLATEAAGGRNRYWFTTERDLMGSGALDAPIWFKAGSMEPVSLRQPE
ncbi:MAG: replication-relaxation family protein [Nitrospirota bacterium]